MKTKRVIFLLALFCMLSSFAIGQSITGEVKDAKTSEPIPGANVVVVGTTIGVVTDLDGKFTLSLPAGAKQIRISFVGYKELTVDVVPGGTYRVSIETDDVLLNEIVVVGYGTQKKVNVTGAVATVDVSKSLEARPINDVGRGLQGTVAGLTIRTPSGDIGSVADIRLRGMSGSLNGSGAKPLILVDNVEVPDLKMINPDDIESISVLKDAASTSIYGARATWGVILVTTKSGKKGKTTVSYSNNFSFSTPTNTPEIADAADGAEMMLLSAKRSNPSLTEAGTLGMYYNPESIQKMRDWKAQYGGQDLGNEMVLGRDFEVLNNKLYFYRPWDAGEMFMKKWTPMQNHDLSVSGGNEKTTYNLSLGYLNQEGILKANQDVYDRYNVTAKVQSAVSKYADVRATALLSKSKYTYPFSYGGSIDPWFYLYRWPKFFPYGTYNGAPFRNSITETEQANMVPVNTNYYRFSGGTTLKPFEGFTIDADYTYANSNTYIHEVGGSVKAIDFWSYGPQSITMGPVNYTSASYNRVKYSNLWNEQNTFKAYATYSKNLAGHSIKTMVGTDVESYKYWSQVSQRNNLVDFSKGELGLATGDQLVSGTRGHWATLGYFGRLNYNYKEKYLLEMNGRFDGSSKFPEGDKWAFFPSFSAGYRITEEEFMKPLSSVLSLMKLRASWGSLGNNDVGSYPYLSTMALNSTSGWILNNLQVPTFNMATAVSPSLTWEKVTTLDLGADVRFFRDKLGFVFDWYQRVTSGMLSAGTTLPSTFGITAPRRNYGEMTTTGWEVTVDFSHRFGNDLSINMLGTLTDFTEKITKYGNVTKGINSFYEGKTIGEIWGYETDRFFTESDFTKDANGLYVLNADVPDQKLYESGFFKYGPGDVKYKDLNGDGVINYGSQTVDDHGDMKVIGNTTPRYQYSFRFGAGWKGIDFDIFFQGVGKRDVWAVGALAIPGFRAGDGWYQHQLDYWTETNTKAFYPRPTDHSEQSIRNFLPQTKYLSDFSYLRLKTLSLGYSIPKHILTRIKVEKLRIYVSGENLWTNTRLKLPIDPEIDNATTLNANYFGRAYPYTKSFSVGVQVNL